MYLHKAQGILYNHLSSQSYKMDFIMGPIILSYSSSDICLIHKHS